MEGSVSSMNQPEEQTVPMENISSYIIDLDKHFEELTTRQRKVRLLEVDKSEAEK